MRKILSLLIIVYFEEKYLKYSVQINRVMDAFRWSQKCFVSLLENELG